MRILVLSIVDPSEARGGAWTVTNGLLKAMALAWPGAEITCVAEPSGSRLAHRLRQVSSILTSVVAGGLPAKVRFTRTRAIRRKLREAIDRGPVDLVVLNGSDLLWMQDSMPAGVPVVVVAHNIEHILFTRQVHRTSFNRVAASTLVGDMTRLRTLELDVLRNSTATIFLSVEDRDFALALLPELKSAVIPPSFDYPPARRSAGTSGRLSIGMFADFTWWPNRASIDWFLREVWPSTFSRYNLELFGHGSDHAARTIANVTSHGFVNDPRDAFSKCDLMIAPIVDGAGIKVKVAEAMYNGVPMIATPAAVSGVFARSNPALHICADAKEWIAFMNGPGAALLAAQAVPSTLRRALTVAAAADQLQQLPIWGQASFTLGATTPILRA